MAPWAKDADGKYIDITVTLSGDTLRYVLDLPCDAVFPVMVDPSTTTTQGVLDAGLETVSGQYTGGSGTGARDTLTATNIASGTTIEVGQYLTGGIYRVYRSHSSYPLDGAWSANVASVDTVINYLWLLTDNSTTDFNVSLYPSIKKGPAVKTWFDDFTGHAATGAYSPNVEYSAVNTSTLSEGQFNPFPFAVTGLDTFEVHVGDSLHVVYLSGEDIGNDAPTDAEYMLFEGSADAGKEPFLHIAYTPTSPTGFLMTSLDEDRMQCDWNDIITGETGYRIIESPYGGPANYIDSVGAGVETITISGLDPDVLYTWKVQVIHADISTVSAEETEATHPALPTGLVITTPAPDTLHTFFTDDSSPGTTEYAHRVITSDTDTLFVDYSATPNVLRQISGLPQTIENLPEWGWETRANIVAFSDSGIIYIPDYIGETLDHYMYSRGQDDGD
jgi:hypothetical protein